MAFQDTSKANIAYKLALGKIHTNNLREPANEPESTRAIVAAQYAWGEAIHPTTPSDSSNANIVSSLVTLNLTPVSGTNGTGVYSAYYCVVPNPVPASLAGKINPKTNAVFAVGDRIGNIIPASMGYNYTPRLYKNSTETPPLDASDWFIDCYAGVVSQETDNTGAMIDYSTNGTVQCYVYIGKNVAESIVAAGTAIKFYDKQKVGNGITGVIDGSNKVFTLAHVPNAGSDHVYFNGMLLEQGATEDYTLSGAVITFSDDYTPTTLDKFCVSYRTY